MPNPAESSPSASERRKHPRAAANWPLSIKLTAGPNAGEHSARVRDVSRAGICFYMEHPIPMLTALELQLDLPVRDGIERVRGSGAVVRCEPIGQGVEHYEIAVFLQHMEESARAAIARYVTALQAG